jgi:long-chain acyl-CoA synthetase
MSLYTLSKIPERLIEYVQCINQVEMGMLALSRALDRFAALSPGTAPLICDDKTWTVSQLHAGASGIAAELVKNHVCAGDAVWLILPSGGSFVLACLAIERIGAVAVPLNPTSALPELLAKADVIPPTAIIIPAELESGSFGDKLGSALSAAGRNCVIVNEAKLNKWAEGQVGTTKAADAAAGSTALVLFTSGTTGQPKGVPLTHDGLLSAAESSSHSLGLSMTDEIASPLPMFHVFGLVVGLMAPWLAGARVRTTRRFAPGPYLSAIAPLSTVLIAVPAMLAGMLAVAGDNPPTTTLRLVATGGSALPMALAERFDAAFGVRPLVGYGMTETSGVISLPSGGQATSGCGWPIEAIEVEIRAKDDGKAETPGIGEIWVRGDNVIAHYLTANGEEIDAVDPHGWFNTGDLGHLSADGEMVIVGRSKEVIIRGGYNVYPAEVEAVLLMHQSVRAAAVVGVPHDELGEEVAAYIVPAEDVPNDAGALIAWARSQLTLYKFPRAIMFVDQLPMTPAGKIMRHMLPPFVAAD